MHKSTEHACECPRVGCQAPFICKLVRNRVLALMSHAVTYVYTWSMSVYTWNIYYCPRDVNMPQPGAQALPRCVLGSTSKQVISLAFRCMAGSSHLRRQPHTPGTCIRVIMMSYRVASTTTGARRTRGIEGPLSLIYRVPAGTPCQWPRARASAAARAATTACPGHNNFE